MANITYTTAINYVMEHYDLPENIAEKMTALREMVEKRNAHHGSDESREKAAAKRKDKTAAERAAYLNEIVPLVRTGIDGTARTADEILERVKNVVPTEFSIAKLRYMLSHNELGDDIIVVGNGRNPKTYYIKEGV